ncbi:hypothetical protein [Knoellia aerolata]|uniref:PknH-like extracellular domain-containing protein n=1 Tax=Knoellia aerolata DSM 18566 TaxID=1385519 RepID=A0A0A0JY06_9MICO|nr:hypothetical protein [Knoellia aerolata]KGN40947.1 hypothetical protein N801_10170 [Knoellia aerolata DSM 18566]
MRIVSTLTLGLLATLAAGCGTSAPRPPVGTPASPSVSTTVVRADDEVVAHGMLMQDSPTADVELCLGGVAESYPPQCGGPTFVGEVDWDAVRPERANGVTWSSGEVWVVGRYDRGTGSSGALTLTRPVSPTPPPGVDVPTEAPATFPQLCDDPYADGGRRGAGSEDERNALGELLPTLDGYVGSWVSDGSSLFNVLVNDDPEAARARLREAWPGGLCVEQRDLPTERDVLAAQSALGSRFGLLTSSGQAMTGGLDVHVTMLDQATLDGILAAVRPWLAPEHVRVTSAFQPLSR